MITVAVTGASGMLGSAVCVKLKSLGIDTIPISRKKSSEFYSVDNYANSPHCDVLVHLSESSDRYWVNQNILEYEVQAKANINALVSKKYKKIVYASSALLYGDSSTKKSVVGDKIYANDGYTRVKKESEKIVIENGGVALRFTNIYGALMSPNNVISSILEQLVKDGPVMLRSASPVRDFLWVDDAAQAIVDAALKNIVGVLNVGSGIGTSIYDMAKLILKLSYCDKKEIISLSEGPHSYLVADIDLTIKKLSWQPITSLTLGLGRLLNENSEK